MNGEDDERQSRDDRGDEGEQVGRSPSTPAPDAFPSEEQTKEKLPGVPDEGDPRDEGTEAHQTQ